jgi:hypothetical protein
MLGENRVSKLEKTWGIMTLQSPSRIACLSHNYQSFILHCSRLVREMSLLSLETLNPVEPPKEIITAEYLIQCQEGD